SNHASPVQPLRLGSGHSIRPPDPAKVRITVLWFLVEVEGLCSLRSCGSQYLTTKLSMQNRYESEACVLNPRKLWRLLDRYRKGWETRRRGKDYRAGGAYRS